MHEHDAFIEQLQRAAREGRDLLPFLEQIRAHILACPNCRQNLAALEQDYYASLMARLEDEGRLAQPAAMPRFDLGFLAAETLPLWLAGPDKTRQLSFDSLRVALNTAAGKPGIRFEGLPARHANLAESAPPAVQARSGQALAAGQSLLLPDAASGVTLRLAAQANPSGLLDLSIVVSENDQPAQDAQARLTGAQGSQISHARQGQVSFLNVKPGDYALEVRLLAGPQAGTRWRLSLAVTLDQPAPP